MAAKSNAAGWFGHVLRTKKIIMRKGIEFGGERKRRSKSTCEGKVKDSLQISLEEKECL